MTIEVYVTLCCFLDAVIGGTLGFFAARRGRFRAWAILVASIAAFLVLSTWSVMYEIFMGNNFGAAMFNVFWYTKTNFFLSLPAMATCAAMQWKLVPIPKE